MPDDRALIHEIEERYVDAMNGAQVMEFDGIFADDAILMMPDRPAIAGREAIVAYYTEFFRSIKASLVSVVAEIEVYRFSDP